MTEDAQVVVRSVGDRLEQEVRSGAHVLISDEPIDAGGGDAGPDPYALLLASLGTCTSMTLHIYARRKGWPLERVTVALSHTRIHAGDCGDCESERGKVDEIRRVITLEGELDDDQRERLLAIADKCPVHRTLTNEIKIRTSRG